MRSFFRYEDGFQFTHPGKGATLYRSALGGKRRFNSRTLGRVRLGDVAPVVEVVVVSIHAPWEGCDCSRLCRYKVIGCFNSRTLGRVRLVRLARCQTIVAVSIHAPWEGCDQRRLSVARLSTTFQFTHPGKGATPHLEVLIVVLLVSIHAPWEGCDFCHS